MKRQSGKPTYKQDLVIRDVVAKLEKGENMDMLGSIEKFYNVKNRATARSVLDKNLKSVTFREGLLSSLVEKGILGGNSKTEEVLLEGLDAVTKDGSVSYDTRLRYVQELNKIAGIYAPETKKTMNLNLDMTEEDLDKKIKDLQEQLK